MADKEIFFEEVNNDLELIGKPRINPKDFCFEIKHPLQKVGIGIDSILLPSQIAITYIPTGISKTYVPQSAFNGALVDFLKDWRKGSFNNKS